MMDLEDMKWTFDGANTAHLYEWARINPGRHEGIEWLEIARRRGYYHDQNEKREGESTG